jgi:hypothetical protein
MPTNFSPMSRRRLLTLPAAAAAASVAAPLVGDEPAASAPRRLVDPSLRAPVARAYR